MFYRKNTFKEGFNSIVIYITFDDIVDIIEPRNLQLHFSVCSPLFCQVIMMVGLPGSGKTHWARILMEQHPEKRYQLLGTETLTASMMVSYS